MRRATSIIIASLVLATAAPASAGGLRGFLRKAQPMIGHQQYAPGGFRLPRLVNRVLMKLRIPSKTRRKVFQVKNENLQKYVNATQKGYLEVVVPKNKGHVYFRYGKEVFDFYPGGFRVGEVRAIRSDRYGMLVPLSKSQEKRLQSYLSRLKTTDAKELGKYDFHGQKGFHCVSWIMRLGIGDKGENLAQLLGGKRNDARSMPRFSRFMLKRAKNVEAVVVYSTENRKSSELDRMNFELMSSKQLRGAHQAE